MDKQSRRQASVTTFPERGVQHARQLAPEMTHEQIDRAVARGRKLHAEAVRHAVERALIAPSAALARLIARGVTRAARELRRRRLRRQTLNALYSLDARMLHDIGIERSDIPFIAESLAAAEGRVVSAAKLGEGGALPPETPRAAAQPARHAEAA